MVDGREGWGRERDKEGVGGIRRGEGGGEMLVY